MQQYATEKRSGATELSYQDWKKQRGVEQIRIIPSLIRVILKDN